MKKDLVEFTHDGELIKINVQPNEWIGDRIKRNNTFYELDLLNYIKSRFNGGVGLDIGANIGNHSLFFSKFIFDKVFSFEPNPTNFSLLLENKLINKINDDTLFLHNIALSDGNYNYKNNDFFGNMGISFITENEGESITKKLDDYDLPEVNLIKMDVEGHELKVLKGAKDLINKYHPHIVLECNNYTDDFERVNPYMLEIGYKNTATIDNMFYYEYENLPG